MKTTYKKCYERVNKLRSYKKKIDCKHCRVLGVIILNVVGFLLNLITLV